MATDGPTLSLLYAAYEALERAERLVVIGYSFGDMHTNAMIRDWMAADSHRAITVLDRDWTVTYTTPGGQFRAQIIRRYGSDVFKPDVVPRIAAVEGTARQKLAEALATTPGRYPNEPVAITTEEGEFGRKLHMILRAPSLTGITFAAYLPGESFPSPAQPLWNVLRWGEDEGVTAPDMRITLPRQRWNEGEQVDLIVEPHASLPLVVRVAGARPSGSVIFEIPVA